MRRIQKKLAGQIILAFVVFFVCAVYVTYPLIFNLGKLTTGFGDEYVISWIIAWVQHSFISNPLNLFNANIYFPYANTLAYSETFITSAILSFPVLLIFHQPIASFNFTFIFSEVMLPFSVFLLSFYVSRNFLVSIISGLLVAFSPHVLDQKVHVQMLAVEWVPLSILFFLKFVNEKKNLWLYVSLAFFLFQFYNAFMPAYFVTIYVGVFLIVNFLVNKNFLIIFFKKEILVSILITLFLMLPIIIPYLKVSSEFHYSRDIRDTIHFALQPEDLLYPNEHTRLSSLLLGITNGLGLNNGQELKYGYLGLIFSLLCLYLLFYVYKNRDRLNRVFYIFLISAFVGLVLSFGPFLHLGRVTLHHPPLPLLYLPFYYLLPGFSGFRNSQRFEMMFVVFITPVIALMLSDVLKKIRYANIFYAILAVCIILEFAFPIHFLKTTQINNFPKFYSDKTLPLNAKIIILPAFNWNMWGAPIEITREYYSTIGFRKMVNGYSGFSPPLWQKLMSDLHNNFPNNKSIQLLKNNGVDFIIVDKNTFDVGFSQGLEKYSGNQVVEELVKNNNVTSVKKIDSYVIFKLE